MVGNIYNFPDKGRVNVFNVSKAFTNKEKVKIPIKLEQSKLCTTKRNC